MTRPSLVYVSFTTEYGTLYTKAELTAISAVCRKYHMYLFVDGARMGYGLGAAENDLTLADFGRLADAFYIGGTKCGAFFGEAVVLTQPIWPPLQGSYETVRRVLAKGWILGSNSIRCSMTGPYLPLPSGRRIRQCRSATLPPEGIEELVVSPTNQQFVILSQEQARKLGQKYVFEAEARRRRPRLRPLLHLVEHETRRSRPARSRHFKPVGACTWQARPSI